MTCFYTFLEGWVLHATPNPPDLESGGSGVIQNIFRSASVKSLLPSGHPTPQHPTPVILWILAWKTRGGGVGLHDTHTQPVLGDVITTPAAALLASLGSLWWWEQVAGHGSLLAAL